MKPLLTKLLTVAGFAQSAQPEQPRTIPLGVPKKKKIKVVRNLAKKGFRWTRRQQIKALGKRQFRRQHVATLAAQGRLPSQIAEQARLEKHVF